ncbi:MAG: hypothetical protein IKO41_15290 [Lachnospiraceae bacterium]|nr:hypothetical protein [Lachnospiraceae bacterium]
MLKRKPSDKGYVRFDGGSDGGIREFLQSHVVRKIEPTFGKEKMIEVT